MQIPILEIGTGGIAIFAIERAVALVHSLNGKNTGAALKEMTRILNRMDRRQEEHGKSLAVIEHDVCER